MPGAVRNADRKCKAKTNFAACGQNLVEYAAMHFASGVFAGVFFKYAAKTAPTGPGSERLATGGTADRVFSEGEVEDAGCVFVDRGKPHQIDSRRFSCEI